MQKLRKAAVALLICSTILMAAFLVYEKMIQDLQAPVISCPEEILEISVDTPEADLLEGVQATDDRDGDVTDAVVVEKYSDIAQDNTRIVTYAVIDAAGNVGRQERTVRYTDYIEPRFRFTSPLRLDKNIALGAYVSSIEAYSPLDGDLSSRIKFYEVLNQYGKVDDLVRIELKVTDSAGRTVMLPLDVERYSIEDERLSVTLNEYLVYHPKGTPFDPRKYCEQGDTEQKILIDSSVDSNIPGIYYVEYTRQENNSYGKSRLVVIVEE